MSRFFIRHPTVAIVIAIFFVIAGGVMIFRLPIAQFPNIVPPQIQTTATYTGADALTVSRACERQFTHTTANNRAWATSGDGTALADEITSRWLAQSTGASRRR